MQARILRFYQSSLQPTSFLEKNKSPVNPNFFHFTQLKNALNADGSA